MTKTVVFKRLTAADKIRNMYAKNLRPKPPSHSLLSDNQVSESRKLFTYFDRNKDGHLDRKEYNDLVTFETNKRLHGSNLNDIFRSNDLNADGLLSENEFLESRGRLKKWQPSQFELYNLFQTCDRNSDKKLSFDEFKSMWRELGEDASRKDLKAIFDSYDGNKDSKINKEELIRLVNQNMKRPIKTAKKTFKHIFKSIDLDRDGKISFGEMLEFKSRPLKKLPQPHDLEALFMGYDKNNDGRINLDEARLCWLQLGEDPNNPNFRRWFVREDTDKDGLIDVFEFQNFVKNNSGDHVRH